MLRRSPVILVLSLLLVGLPGCGHGADRSGEVPAPPVRVERALHPVDLPGELDGWTLQNGPNRYDDRTIFDYMNGGAEIFIGYRYQHLDVYEYGSAEGGDIVVEIYTMKESDDAYGLQSMDRTGQCLDFDGKVPEEDARCLHPTVLYGNGYLRLWAGERHARLLAYEESEASRGALLSLARVIANNRTEPTPPRIIASLVEEIVPSVPIDSGSVVFVRSHLVLGSFSQIDPENSLGLGLETEALSATYRPEGSESSGEGTELLLVRYPSEEAAEEADRRFRGNAETEGEGRGDRFWEDPDGWSGALLGGADLAIVKGAIERDQAQSLLESTLERSRESR